jgi:hypothetical protein
MTLLVWALAVLTGASASHAPAPSAASNRLGELARAVLSADYRGNRPELLFLDGELAKLPDGPLSEYRDYWRGFARWRRAMNGFNETPMPGDLQADVEGAIARFRAALERHPDWIEARLALAGCWGNLIYVAGKDEGKRKAILEEASPTFRWVMEYTGDNPRALWIRGGYELWAANNAQPPKVPDFGKPVETFRQALEGARKEALANPDAPAWVPTWGGPENLMNLAYYYSKGPKPDREAAIAYAQGALVSVPQWHYVGDVLLPQIEAMPVASAAP